MIRILLMAGFVLGAAASSNAQDAGTIEKGVKVYSAQKCQVCHSIQGVGNRRGALDDVGARLTAEDIRRWIVDAADMTARTKSERKPAMRSYTLAKEDLDALVAYMVSLKKKS